MKNFEELSNFIKNNNDWLSKLKPWLKSYHECDYNNDWVILMYNLFEIPTDPLLYKIICECRGTVVNKKTGEIISAPFVKFWNYGEEKADKNIDWKNAIYSMKRDGWLVKLSKYNDKAYVFTNGMFLSKNNSGASVEATIHPEYGFKTIGDVLLYCLNSKGFNDDGSIVINEDWVNNINNGDTVIFELETPWNVVHTHLTDKPLLWLIGYRKADGQEINIYKEKTNIPFSIPKIFDYHSSDELISEMKKWKIDEEGEGIVVLSIDNNNNFHRVKIKCDDYIRVKYLERDTINDNKLFNLMLSGEADDLIAADENLTVRAKHIQENYDRFVKLGKGFSTHMNWLKSIYSNDRKKIVDFLKNKKEFSMLMACYNGNESFIKQKTEQWKIKKNSYNELIKILEV